MKKMLALLLAALCMAQLTTPSYSAEPVAMPEPDPIPVYFNGDILETPISPLIQEGRCLVPFRALFEALGAQVYYNPETRLITARRGVVVLQMTPDDPLVDLSGMTVELDVAPCIFEDYTLVPLRFVGEALGAKVRWDSGIRAVFVNYTPPAPEPEVLNENILGDAEVSVETAKAWAKDRKATDKFIAAADLYWQYGVLTGIRPEVLYCQAAKETGFGRYGGAVTEDMNNFAGIKTSTATGDTTEDHQAFATVEDGVRGHFNHISAYVGLEPIGDPHPRYYNVKSIAWAGTIRTVTELGGRWAPASDYGESILNHYLKPLVELENQ